MINRARGNIFILTLATPVVNKPGSPVDYNDLINKPKINGVELDGEVTLEDLGVQPAGNYPDEPLTAEDVDEIIGVES